MYRFHAIGRVLGNAVGLPVPITVKYAMFCETNLDRRNHIEWGHLSINVLGIMRL